MNRTSFVLATAALALLLTSPLSSQQPILRSSLHQFRAVPVAEGLINPWSIAFLPSGDMLVTERPGRLRIVRNGELLPDAVQGVPAVLAQGQGGLLDVVPHPSFSTNRFLYISYSKPLPEGGATTAVARGKFENDRLSDVKDIFVAVSKGQGHYGCRLAFDKNGFLFITTGDRQVPSTGDLAAHPAQDLTNHHGKISRIHDDGRIPADNPFVNRPGAKPEIWSYGHRNPQGLLIHPVTGDVWSTEHGPQGGDELNLIQPGKNYGWPVIGYGVNYRTGSAIHIGTHKEGMETPVHFWVPSIATAGMVVYTGDRFPEWKGNVFVGGMVGEQLARLTLDGQRVRSEETLLQGMGRIRDVRQSPDGFLYLAMDGRQNQPTAILRLEPAAPTP